MTATVDHGGPPRSDPRPPATGRLTAWRQDAPAALRFLVVGGLATVVTIGLFNLLVHVGSRPVLASHPVSAFGLAMVVGLVVNYTGNRYWAFTGRSTGSRWREVTAFVVTNAIAIAIPSACLAISRYALGLSSALADNVSSNVVGLVLATLVRWLAYRHLVFAGQPVPAEVSAAEQR